MGGDNNLIHSCVRSSNGSIRIVDPNGTCANNETPLDWSHGGSTGTPGIVGFYQRKATLNCSTNGGCPMSEPLVANCDTGDMATGGAGYYLTSGLTPHQARASIPYPL